MSRRPISSLAESVDNADDCSTQVAVLSQPWCRGFVRWLYILTFPLDFSGLSQLTLQGAGHESTILDAAFVDDVITADGAGHLVIDGVTLTKGVHGIEVFGSTSVTLRHSRSTGNSFDGGAEGRIAWLCATALSRTLDAPSTAGRRKAPT